jgi:putative oxidoreductase
MDMSMMPIDFPVAIIRIATGVFFTISGFNKLFVASRHESLKNNLEHNGIPVVGFMQWWVPGWEFVAGMMLTIGLLTPVAAFVLTTICIVACCCESRGKVEAYHPINGGDTLADYLYLPEVLYICLLSVSLFSGGGVYSVDNWLF